MLVLVYHKCSTCQKALKWLDEHKIFFEERPIIEDEQLKLLATDGMLVKRPLVVGEDFVLTGFREKEWEEKIRG